MNYAVWKKIKHGLLYSVSESGSGSGSDSEQERPRSVSNASGSGSGSERDQDDEDEEDREAGNASMNKVLPVSKFNQLFVELGDASSTGLISCPSLSGCSS